MLDDRLMAQLRDLLSATTKMANDPANSGCQALLLWVRHELDSLVRILTLENGQGVQSERKGWAMLNERAGVAMLLKLIRIAAEFGAVPDFSGGKVRIALLKKKGE